MHNGGHDDGGHDDGGHDDGGHSSGKAVVQLLLERGADVNAQSRPYDNALQAASSGRNEAVVELLLKNGADVNAQGGESGNVFIAASKEGHEAVVQSLTVLQTEAESSNAWKHSSGEKSADFGKHRPVFAPA
jgi:ankyrin repeat protein